MTTGTEGPDVLTNDQNQHYETINALGGDDTINVTNPRPAVRQSPVASVSINGGDGFDTLKISAPYINLSPGSAFVFDGYQFFTFHGATSMSWSQVERLVVSGTAYSGRNQDGSYAGTGWSTGDTIDELSVGTVGGARITVSSGGGNDKITIRGNVGVGSSGHGGAGDDLIDLSGASFDPGFVFDQFGNRLTYISANGEDGNDTLIGNSQENRLNGGAGNDQLRSGLGNDTLRGEAGDDLLYFGAAFTGADLADGGDGRDALVLQGNYALTLGGTQLIGLESISLQSGANTQFGDTANNFYDFAITTADGNVAAGQQMIVNGQSLRAGEDLTFDGSAESDGRFLVFGGHGIDTLKGGAGNDIFVFDGYRWGAGDRVDGGGGGGDAVVITGGTGLTRIDFGAASLVGVESLSVSNRYASDPNAVPTYEFVLDNGNVAPGATLIVNASSLHAGQLMKLDGSGVHDGNLILFGGAGHDTLIAGAGDDVLIGGTGSDSLTGRLGADTFRYDATSDSTPATPDLIGDFQAGTDRIDLSRIDADTATAGDQAFSWIGSNAFSGAAGELRVFEDIGYQRIEGDTDGDGDADLLIVLQVGTAPLGQADFAF